MSFLGGLFNNDAKITVQISDPPLQQPAFVHLNLTDNLSIIRKQLENDNIINDTLSFSKKIQNNNNSNYRFAEILHEKEENFKLNEITDDNHILYLLESSKPSLKFLNKKCKLDYGCAMSFDGIKKATKRAFILKDCELTEIGAEGYKKDNIGFESSEDWMKKTNLFVNVDGVDVKNFAKLGLSIGISQNENVTDEIKSVYNYTELGRVSLKLSKKSLEPTPEFIKAVKDAIESKDLGEFRKITEEYGQFVSTEVILGGRVYFKDDKMSTRNSKEGSKEGSVNIDAAKVGYNSSESKKYSRFYSFNRMRLLGGKYPDGEKFNEKAWIESLNDYHNWDCIEFKNLISVFQLLPDDLPDDLHDLRKKTFKSIGKRILYTNTEDCDYHLNEPGRLRIFELKLPQNILDIIPNEEADCDIFAAVNNTKSSKNVFFNCQILRKQKAKPSIVIHGIQKEFRKRKYKLKIKIMVIGYDIDFNACYDTDFSFILSDISVELIRKEYSSKDKPFDSKMLKPNGELIEKNIPFLGIPVLSDISNNSLIIGHHFRKNSSDNELKIDAFSYCLKSKLYVNLPEFTFCTLIISNYSCSDVYELLPFKFAMFGKPFINLKEPNSLNPKYASLYLSEDNNYSPIFLNQNSKQINVEYVDCNCNRTCFICINKTLRISKNNNIECILYYFK